MTTKKQLAIYLSRLSGFTSPSHKAEQYVTDSEVAADMLWNAYNLDDIARRRVVDLGSGPGMLGIGASVLGCMRITFVERDNYSLSLASAHFAKLEQEIKAPKANFEQRDVNEFSGEFDTVIMNPPFGTRVKHADREFLSRAFTLAPVIYSLHKTTTRAFLEKFAATHGYSVTHVWDYSFPLKATQSFHTRKVHRIEVSAFRFVRA